LSESKKDDPSVPSPPRAFTQGVGTVFQIVGVTTFLGFFFVCCLSGLLSKDTATHTHLADVGWGAYSAQRAVSISMAVGIFFGVALAGIGLGLQAQRRLSPAMAVLACAIATAYWLIHTMLFAQTAHSWTLSGLSAILSILFLLLLFLAIGAWMEMRRNPPPIGYEILPADYKVPYSHMHQDPPEVRLARELEQRRERLAVQQKELEMLEEKLHRKLKDDQK
jgi:hypothetical protein